MIEPDRAGIAHRARSDLPIRFEGLNFQTGGVEPGEAPFWPVVLRASGGAPTERCREIALAPSTRRTRRIAHRRPHRDTDRPSFRASWRDRGTTATAGRQTIERI